MKTHKTYKTHKIQIKQIILAEASNSMGTSNSEPIQEGLINTIKGLIPQKKAFKIESTPADTRRLKAVQNEIQKTKKQLEVVKAHQNIINGKRYNGEPKPVTRLEKSELLNTNDNSLFKSSKIHPKVNTPYTPYTKVDIRA